MALWIDEQSGRITCETLRHSGLYLNSAIEGHPRRSTHTTPLGVWHRIPRDEIAAIRDEIDRDLLCESCYYDRERRLEGDQMD